MSEASVIKLEERVHILELENARLCEEKKHLSDTVEWMHDLIWDLIRRNRSIGAA